MSWKMIPGIVLGAFCLIFLAYIGLMPFPFQVGFHLAFGWIIFLWRVGPQMRLDLVATFISLFCLIFLAMGSHLFLRWLARQMSTEGWPLRWTAMMLALVVLLFVAGISAVGITHQLTWLARSDEPIVVVRGGIRRNAARMQSANNLKQIGIAAHYHSDSEKAFPPGIVLDSRGEALHGWQTLLLPWMEEENLYRRVNLQKPWYHSENRPALETKVSPFQHPLVKEDRDASGLSLTHYAGNFHVLGRARPLSINQFRDGTSNTIFAGEVWKNYSAWGRPGNWRDPALGLKTSSLGFGSPMQESSDPPTQFLMADGSVRALTGKVSRETLQALATPDGGEPVGDDW